MSTPRGLRRRLDAAGPPVVGIVVVLGFFEVAPRIGVLPRSSFPPTSEVAGVLVDMLDTSELWTAVRRTLGAWAWAMVVAVLIGVPLGLAIGASRVGALLCRFTIEFLRPVPSVSLIPVLVLVYGTDSSLTVALGAFGATFPVLFQAMYGVGDVDPVAKDMSRTFGMGWLPRLRYIVLPSCAPYLATGLRISAAVALILVVTGEYVVGVPGLGQKVFVAQSGGAYDRVYAWVVVTGLVGLAVNVCFGAVERRFLRWHPTHERTPVDTL